MEDEYRHLTHGERRRIQTLEKRRDHLAERIAQNPDRNLSYDRAELGALNWALQYIKERVW